MSPVHSPTAALPGWRLILDAFMGSPDRTLTNVQLGQVRGVQAFHQRISDLGRKGYLITPAVRIGEGYFAYDLMGRKGGTDDLPYADRLPVLEGLDLTDSKDAAIDRIKREADNLLKRTARPSAPTGPASEHLEALRQDAATARGYLAHVLGREQDNVPLADLAKDAAEEIEALRARKPERAARAARQDRGPTGPQLMRKALEYHGDPMHASAIAAWVMTNGGADVYHGKTPAATMAAQLATSNKTGGEFEKVAPGIYALREWDDDAKAQTPVTKAAGA